MRILHLAVENYAGIPMRLVCEERQRGHHSRLITLYAPHQKYDEDISMHLPLINSNLMPLIKRLIRRKKNNPKTNNRHIANTPKIWQPSNVLEKLLFLARDKLWKKHISKALREIGNIEEYDVIIADGGHDFTRFPNILLNINTPLAICYYGSDLRNRGIISKLQNKSIATFTFEYDHIHLLPEAEFLFYPYCPSEYAPIISYKQPSNSSPIIVGHAPTHRAAKGTDDILSALELLKHEYPIEICLIEGVSHQKALIKKSQCHIFIDQIGELGYGLNSVESAWMGIPTCVELMPDFEQYLAEKCGEPHPFYNIRRSSLIDDLRRVFEEKSKWMEHGKRSMEWVMKYHSIKKVSDIYLGRLEELTEQIKRKKLQCNSTNQMYRDDLDDDCVT